MLFLNGLYVGAEFATVSARRTRIRQLAATGNKMALRLMPVIDDANELDDYIATCQLGITVSSLALGAFGERYIVAKLSQDFGLVINTALISAIVIGLLTLSQVILGELFPKSLALQFPEKLALAVVVPVRWSQALFRPLVFFFNGSSRLLLRMIGREDKSSHSNLYSSDEIEILVSESHEGGLLEDDERMMLRNAFRLSDLTVRQVMIHRTKLVTASIDSSVDVLLDIALESGHTRIPVYKETVDNIVGFVHIKDVFRILNEGKTDLHEIMREVIHIPESLPVTNLWGKLNKTRQYMAIVFDEYGGTEGMVTQEDLIEEIFGELQDEFDNEKALIRLDEVQNRIHLRGDLLVADVNEYLQMSCPEDGADTIGGLVFNELRKLPEVGDTVTISGVLFRVEVSDDLAIDELSIPNLPEIGIDDLGEWEVSRD